MFPGWPDTNQIGNFMEQKQISKARDFLASRYSNQLEAMGVSPSNVPDDFDLLTAGVVDSLGLIELVVAVEKHFGCPVDFADLDAEQVTVFGSLADFIDARIAQP